MISSAASRDVSHGDVEVDLVSGAERDAERERRRVDHDLGRRRRGDVDETRGPALAAAGPRRRLDEGGLEGRCVEVRASLGEKRRRAGGDGGGDARCRSRRRSSARRPDPFRERT